MKERIFTTKEQGRVLVEAGLPISTAIGFRDKYRCRDKDIRDLIERFGFREPEISGKVFRTVKMLTT